jgi:hypothetical protein
VVEVDHRRVIDIDQRSPQIQGDVVWIAARSKLMAKHLGCRAKRMKTQILDDVGSGAVKTTIA